MIGLRFVLDFEDRIQKRPSNPGIYSEYFFTLYDTVKYTTLQ